MLMLRVLAVALAVSVTWGRTVQWTGGQFSWVCPTVKNIYKANGKYVPKHVIATRAAIYKDTAYLALPRYRAGVPATLATVSLSSTGCQATLNPFPCWTLQEEGTCAALQNVVDIHLDPQDLLWVLDTGVVNTLDEPTRKCPPKVVVIDVKSGKIVRSIDLSNIATASSRLQYVASDVGPDGSVFVYVSDAANRAILVHNVSTGTGYRVLLPKAVANGASKLDVLYMALLRRPDGSSCIIFTYLGSDRLFSIKSDYLRSGSQAGKVSDIGQKPRKMVILGTDNGSALFFRYSGSSDIYRWDILDCYNESNFQLVYKGTECLLPTQVIPDYKRNTMRVLESSFPDYFQGTVGCGANHALVGM